MQGSLFIKEFKEGIPSGLVLARLLEPWGRFRELLAKLKKL